MKNQEGSAFSESILRLQAEAAAKKAFNKAFPRARKKADDELLKTVNAVLEQVQGSYVCAAKLLDMTYARLKNLVNGNPWLKSKWGKGRGRPAGLKFELRIQPFVAPPPFSEPWRTGLLGQTKMLILKSFSPAQIDELSVWLEWLKSQRDLNQDERKSLDEWSESEKAN